MFVTYLWLVPPLAPPPICTPPDTPPLTPLAYPCANPPFLLLPLVELLASMSEATLKKVEREKAIYEADLAAVEEAIPVSQACKQLYAFMNASEIEGGVPEPFTLPLEAPNPYHSPIGAHGGCCTIS